MDTGIQNSRLRAAARAMAAHLGNRHNRMRVDAAETLIHVALAVRGSVAKARETFAALRLRWPTLRDLKGAKEVEVLELIRPLGFGRSRWRVVRAILRASPMLTVEAVDGDLTLGLDRMMEIPGVGPKVARCAALYAWNMPVVPLDVHGVRVTARILGVDPRTYPDRAARRTVERALEGTDLHYAYHMNAMMLGRSVCRPMDPDCPNCPLAQIICATGSKGDE